MLKDITNMALILEDPRMFEKRIALITTTYNIDQKISHVCQVSYENITISMTYYYFEITPLSANPFYRN